MPMNFRGRLYSNVKLLAVVSTAAWVVAYIADPPQDEPAWALVAGPFIFGLISVAIFIVPVIVVTWLMERASRLGAGLLLMRTLASVIATAVPLALLAGPGFDGWAVILFGAAGLMFGLTMALPAEASPQDAG